MTLLSIVASACVIVANVLAPFGSPFSWPVSPVHFVRGYQPPVQNWLSGHRGVDLATVPGQSVVSPASGSIRFAGVVSDRGVVSVLTNSGVIVTVEPVQATVTTGESILAGQPLGTVSPGGHCGTHCIHIGVIIGGEYHSPLAVFRSPWPRLKPLSDEPSTRADAPAGRPH